MQVALGAVSSSYKCLGSADCRAFEDTLGTCIDGACLCSDKTDSSDYCSGNTPWASPDGLMKVLYVMSFRLNCSLVDLPVLIVEAARDKAYSLGFTPRTNFICSSTVPYMILRGTVPLSDIAAISDKLSDAVDEVLVEGIRINTTTSLKEGTGSSCPAVSPVAESTSIGFSCVALSCVSGYRYTMHSNHTIECVENDSDERPLYVKVAIGFLGAMAVCVLLIICIGSGGGGSSGSGSGSSSGSGAGWFRRTRYETKMKQWEDGGRDGTEPQL